MFQSRPEIRIMHKPFISWYRVDFQGCYHRVVAFNKNVQNLIIAFCMAMAPVGIGVKDIALCE